MKKVNENTLNSLPERTITLDLWKAIAIMGTAMLGSAGAGLYGSLATINSDHFTIRALDGEISNLKEQLNDVNLKFMPLDLASEKWKNNDKQHDEIIRRLDVIQTTLGRLK